MVSISGWLNVCSEITGACPSVIGDEWSRGDAIGSMLVTKEEKRGLSVGAEKK